MRTLGIDMDGVICQNTYGKYEKAKPYADVVDQLKAWRSEGWHILIFTGRPWSLYEQTKAQLMGWGVPHDELIMGKPHMDWFIDDRSVKTARELALLMEFEKDGRFRA